jgi:hypothetical protein
MEDDVVVRLRLQEETKGDDKNGGRYLDREIKWVNKKKTAK